MKVSIFGGFSVENPTNKATDLKALLTGISLSEYGSEGFPVRSTRLSEYGSVACLVERPTRETQAEQYSDTVPYGPLLIVQLSVDGLGPFIVRVPGVSKNIGPQLA